MNDEKLSLYVIEVCQGDGEPYTPRQFVTQGKYWLECSHLGASLCFGDPTAAKVWAEGLRENNFLDKTLRVVSFEEGCIVDLEPR